jgi:putative restriction endonuclease
MLNALSKYLHAFKKLHVDRSHGIAPHKPLLLLSVLQSFEQGRITENRIVITPELVALFKSNWNALVITKHDCRMSYPFYFLKTDKFWKLVPRHGFENINQMISISYSFSNLNTAIEFAFLDEDLYLLMVDKLSNSILQHFLLDTYFPETKGRLLKDNQYILFDDLKYKILNEESRDYKNEIIALMNNKDEEEIYLRGNVFKREIPRIYNSTCCISGLRIDSETSVSMIDACHIIPFSKSYDDTVSNGIALCPNLHRAFDRGLITLDDKYRVIVSKVFTENECGYGIKNFEGRTILLPDRGSYYPLQEKLEWHRTNIFKN